MALYRNTLAARSERIEEVSLAIEETRRALATLRAESDELTARWQEAIEWGGAPPALTRFRRGVALGLGVVGLLPVIALPGLASLNVPLAALLCFFR